MLSTTNPAVEENMELTQRPQASPSLDWMQKLSPAVSAAQKGIEAVSPIFEKAISFCEENWHYIDDYDFQLLLPTLVGFVMVFFGGSYMMLIATVEAYRLTGWSNTQEALLVLYHNYQSAAEASKKDDTIDENNDGIADAKQLPQPQLYQRKLSLFLKTVNPLQLQASFSNLYMSFMAVAATLRVQLAKTITLGASCGEVIENAVGPIFSEALRTSLPNEHHKWIPIIVSSAAKMVGISIAWLIFRAAQAVYSAVRGAQLMVSGILLYCRKQKLIGVPTHEESLLFNALVFACAASGVMWQLQNGLSIPFPLNVLLLPLTMAEHFLVWAVNWA